MAKGRRVEASFHDDDRAVVVEKPEVEEHRAPRSICELARHNEFLNIVRDSYIAWEETGE
jgi:hypothetical protein